MGKNRHYYIEQCFSMKQTVNQYYRNKINYKRTVHKNESYRNIGIKLLHKEISSYVNRKNFN